MGMKKLEDKSQRLIRVMKTIFFLITLSISFLLISAPIFLVIADALLPAALLSASLSSSSTSSTDIGSFPSSSSNNNNSPLFYHKTLSSCFHNYDFRYSLIDIPSISIIRSIIIICVYSCCDGPRRSRGPYLWATTMCSLLSLMFVSFKASFVFGINNNTTTSGGGGGGGGGGGIGGGVSSGTEVALFVSSYALAVGHVMVAYRICCRERKKLLVYKIDIEAVSACNNGFPIYHQKLLQQQRMK